MFSTQECDNLWWDAFTTEFFEDDAMLTITFCLEDGPKRYSECPPASLSVLAGHPGAGPTKADATQGLRAVLT